MGFGDEHAIPEIRRPEPVRVDADEEPSATLAALRERAHLHHLACRSDRDIAIRAVVGSRDDLTLKERTNLAEAGDGGTGREHGPTGVEHHPDLTLGRGDGRLVDEPKQPAIVAA